MLWSRFGYLVAIRILKVSSGTQHYAALKARISVGVITAW
jgi:hypothetical protein